MPLDRPITLGLEAEGTYVMGVYRPGPVTNVRAMAQLESAGSTDQTDRTGTFVTEVIRFTIRYREDVARHPISRMEITDEYGHTFNIETKDNEAGGRRRYISLSAIRTDRDP